MPHGFNAPEKEGRGISVASGFPAAYLCLPYGRREIAWILGRMAAKARELGHRLESVELWLSDDAGQAATNLRCMGLKGPTNILSFPDEGGGALSLAPLTYARERFFYGQEEREYFLRLLAHGMAHLCGLEHGTEMERLCEELAAAGRGAG